MVVIWNTIRIHECFKRNFYQCGIEAFRQKFPRTRDVVDEFLIFKLIFNFKLNFCGVGYISSNKPPDFGACPDHNQNTGIFSRNFTTVAELCSLSL